MPDLHSTEFDTIVGGHGNIRITADSPWIDDYAAYDAAVTAAERRAPDVAELYRIMDLN